MKCGTCGGSGLDSLHTWPNGMKAHCEECDGYGKSSKFFVVNDGEGLWITDEPCGEILFESSDYAAAARFLTHYCD